MEFNVFAIVLLSLAGNLSFKLKIIYFWDFFTLYHSEQLHDLIIFNETITDLCFPDSLIILWHISFWNL